MNSNIITVATEPELQGVFSKNRLVLVDFYAVWCEPCKYLDEVLERLLPQLPTDACIVKVDAEHDLELSRSYHVMSVPVLILFKYGKEVWRMNGFHLEDELLKIITSVSRETD